MARRLIVNADDLGRAESIDRGVMRAHRDGIVTSATLMTNAPSTDHAARLVRATPSLDVGVHLVLTYGRPLTDATRLRSIVRDDGTFPRPTELLAKDIDHEEALDEYRAQFARVRELIGRNPTHVDSHHWVHDHPALSWALCQVAGENGAAARAHDPAQRDEYRARGVRTADRFIRAFQHEGHVDVESLLAIIGGLGDGVTELMCHPGEADPELVRTSGYAALRPVELATLTDRRVRDALARHEVALTTFAAL